jgi:regulator of protease activity HflC (stomatin/prohibitin superfamily)
LAVKKGKGIVVLVNKWDLLEKETNTARDYEKDLRQRLAPFNDVPIVFISVVEKQRIFKSIEADFKARGLVLEQLLIRNINLPASVKTTIESKINAEQDAQKMTFVLQKEKQEAERKRVEAQGIADYQKIISTGLTDKQLQYEQIKAQKEKEKLKEEYHAAKKLVEEELAAVKLKPVRVRKLENEGPKVPLYFMQRL